MQPASGGRLIHELNRHAAVVMEPLPANMADDAATAAAELEKARKAAMADPRALDPAAAAAGFQDSHRRGGSGLDDLRVVRDDGFSKLTIQVAALSSDYVASCIYQAALVMVASKVGRTSRSRIQCSLMHVYVDAL